MENKFTQNNFTVFVRMAFTLFFLFSTFFVQAQQLIDTLNWSTSCRNALVATGQNSLYIGGISSIGKARGPQAFFLNGSTEPDAGMPFFTDEGQMNSRDVYAFVGDGSGGWYVGGDFLSVNGEKTGPLVHIRSDKSLEVPFVNNLSFSSYYSWPYVWVIKKSGDFLYVGGDFTATDGAGNKYRSLFRVNLATKTVDASFNPFSTFSGDTILSSAQVKEIEITGNKVFVSGQFGFDKPKGSKNTLVFNTNTGKMMHFYNGIGHIKLIGDTLLFISNDYLGVGLPLAWSNNGGNTATLDTLVDSVAQNVLEGSHFIYSVPDGRGGWFVAGTPGWNKKQGIFHLDRNLQIDTAFKQFHFPTDYYGNLIGLSQMTVAGNSLFVAFNGKVDVDGVKLSGLLKLDTATGSIDKTFRPNPSSGPNFWKVYSLAAKGDTLFVAGHFDSIAGQKQPNLAAVRVSTGAFIGWYPSVQPLNFWDGSIRQMKIKNDTLYAAGDFKVPGTPDINYLARFDLKTGSVDTTFHIDAFTGKYMHITGMAIWENKFFINGNFSLDAQGKKISNLAYVDLNDKTVHPVLENCRIDNDYGKEAQMAAYGDKIYVWGQSLTDSSDFVTRPYFFSFYAGSGRLTSWSPNPSDLATFSVSDGKLLLSGSQFSRLKSYYLNNEKVYFGAINTHTFRFIPFFAPGHKAPPAPDGSISCNEKYVFGKLKGAYGDSLVHGVLRLKRRGLTYAPFHYHIKNAANPDQVALGTNGLYLSIGISTPGNYEKKVFLLQPDSGTLLDWQPVFPERSINNMMVSGKDVLLHSDANLLWPSYTRWGGAKIDLTTGDLSSDWMPEFKSTKCCVSPYVPDMKKMLLSGDTLFVLFDKQTQLNGIDTGNLFAVSPATGQIISGFKPPRFQDGYMTIPARSFAYNKGALFVIGDFEEINGKKHIHLAKINSATGEVEPWNPKLAASGTLNDVVVYKDTVYVIGYGIEVIGDSDIDYDLISIDGKTGKIIKKYKYPFKFADGTFQKIAVDQSGTVMLVPYAMFDTVCVLKPGARDTLVRVPKLLGKGSQYTAIRPFGKNFVLAVSHMKEQGKSTTKPGFVWYNPQRDTVFYSFSIPVTGGDNKVTSMAFFNNMMVAAGNLNNVFGHPEIKNLAFIKLSNIRLKPGITSWTPHKADNRNPFAVNIYGYGFSDSSSVELYSGDTAVQPDSLTYSNYKLTAWFDGRRFSVGDWNLRVKISDSLTKDYAKAIHIYRGTYADMWAKWVGPKVVLVHKPETYYVTYGNKGNSDAFGVFLYLAVGEHQKIIFPDSLHVPHINYQNFSLDADTMSRYIHVDDFFGKPFHGKVYTLFIPYMPANTENAIKLFIRSDVHGETPEMRLAISQPLYDSYGEMMDHLKSVGGSLAKCLYDIVGNVAQLNPAGGCVKSVVDNIIMEKYNLAQAGKSAGWWFWTKQTALVALDCAGVSEIKAAYKLAKDVTLLLVNGHSTFKDCQDFYHQVHGNNANAVVHASVDPNDKYGPTGMHSSHYVRSDIPYHYLITFENDSNATAPAERVVIKDTLDQSVFDLNTFKALGFGFGDTTYLYREQDKDTVYIDLRPAKNTIVRVFYHLDKSSGVLTWTFQSLDPSTYEYVSDPSDGFLPPNKKAPEGDGNVLYSIRPLSGLSQGTMISNTAHIVFDWNDEMATKAWINKTDNTAPESAVKSLPSYETDKDFTVSWGGSDEGSGIYSYTVYVSENDSAYYPWIIDTHDTSAVFSGTFGSTYKFYTVATDSAGNVESVPGIYDAMTRLSGTGIETFGQGDKMQFRLYPNPATDRLNLDCYLPQSSEVRIDLMNVCGHLVKEPITLNGTRGIVKNSVDVSTLPAGTYFVRILTKYGSQVRKVIVR